MNLYIQDCIEDIKLKSKGYIDMKVSAQAKYVRISPTKLNRIVKELIGLKVDEAIKLLSFLPHRGSDVLQKVVKSAKSNAEHNYNLKPDYLVISEGYVGQAGIMKRFRAMSKGRAGLIQKKISHVTIIVKEEGSH